MDNDDYIMVMDELAKTIGAIQGKSSGCLYDLDGLTPEQRFYIAYARLWGQNITEAEIRRLTKIDPHSLGLLRVNQALKNIDPFYKAFQIKPSDKMYLAPSQRVLVW